MQNTVSSISLSLRQLADEMRAEAPVFVVGPPRSGTSIMYRTILEQPEFCPESGPLPSVAETFAFCNPNNLLHLTSHVERFLESDSEAITKWREFAESLYGPKWNPDLSWRLYRASCRVGVGIGRAWSRTRECDLTLGFLRYAQIIRNVPRLVEKTPLHLKHLPEIFGSIPQSSVVCMCRYPVDVFASYRRRYKKETAAGEKKKSKWLAVSPEEFSEQFNDYARTIVSATHRYRGRFKVVIYEHFTAKPQGVIKSVREFVGCNPDEFRLPQPGEGDHVDERVFQSIQMPRLNYWDFMSESEANLIVKLTTDSLKRLGFEKSLRDALSPQHAGGGAE